MQNLNRDMYKSGVARCQAKVSLRKSLIYFPRFDPEFNDGIDDGANEIWMISTDGAPKVALLGG